MWTIKEKRYRKRKLFYVDYSRLTWVSFLKEKSKVFEKFKVFKALTKNQTRKRLKEVRSDRGGEFSSWNFKEFYDKHGIKREYTIPRTPQQNGVVERCWSGLCFLTHFEFYFLMLEIESCFSYFSLFFPKSQKSHHASSDGYHTLKASYTFHSNDFFPFSYLRISHVGCHRSHSSQVPKSETTK